MLSTELVTGEVTISVAGQPLTLKISVPAKPVKPQMMLPVFQNLANAFTEMAVGQLEREGQKISCKKGCAACCRQVIPLTEVEIYYLAMLVDFMPEPRRSVIRSRFENAAAHFTQNGWRQRFDDCADEAALNAANRAYYFEGLACPFLEEESCSIYAQRPIACREFMVTSPAAACISDTQAEIRQMPIAVSALDGLSRVGKTGRLSAKGFLPMVFMQDWVSQYPEDFEMKTGPEWLEAFFT